MKNGTFTKLSMPFQVYVKDVVQSAISSVFLDLLLTTMNINPFLQCASVMQAMATILQFCLISNVKHTCIGWCLNIEGKMHPL